VWPAGTNTLATAARTDGTAPTRFLRLRVRHAAPRHASSGHFLSLALHFPPSSPKSRPTRTLLSVSDITYIVLSPRHPDPQNLSDTIITSCQWPNLYSTNTLSRITSGVRSSPVSPPSLTHHIGNSFTESGDDFEPMPGAMSDLSGPFSEECVDFSDADLKLWSWFPTPAVRLAEVSFLFHVSYRARSVGRSGCCKRLCGSLSNRCSALAQSCDLIMHHKTFVLVLVLTVDEFTFFFLPRSFRLFTTVVIAPNAYDA
jgi:hypothetical protein